MTCCGWRNVVYPHGFSVYHATSVQNDYGELERTWALAGSYRGLVRDITQTMSDPGTIGIYAPQIKLSSQTQLVVNGLAFQEIAIADIVDLDGTILFPDITIDANTVFELRGVEPMTDPTGRISHYNYRLVRAQAQASPDILPWGAA